MDSFRAVICGGGFAGIEGLLRLHRLAGDRVAVTLLTPEDVLVYRPLTVLAPFEAGTAARYPIERIAADAHAHWVRDSADWVDPTNRVVHTTSGQQLNYDALLLAIGGRERKPDRHLAVFSDQTSGQVYRGIVRDVEAGVVANLALVEPAGPSWPLPLYELALLTARHAAQIGAHAQIVVITPHTRPLHSFGEEAGEVVMRLLQEAGIALYTSAQTRVLAPRQLVLEPSGIRLDPDQIITLPTITGPNLRGIPGEARDRFIPVDERCRVRGLDGHVFAAGDATDLPIKHGGLAAQQADTAAGGISHLAGVTPRPAALRPVMRGSLLTGDKPLYLSAHLIAGSGWRAQIHEQPPWPVNQAVVAEELAPYLAGLEPVDTHGQETRPHAAAHQQRRGTE
jgi:sulfide:quinone oxidoreductase